MLSTDTRAVATASRILAERWTLSNAAASAAIADMAEETGVEGADLAALIVAAVSSLLPEETTSPHLVADPTTGSAATPSDIEAGWDDVMIGLERRVLGLGADGLSLGLVNGSRVHTFNRGFSERTSAVYATISAEADLPGPATLRSSEAQYFESHEIVGARYPKAVGIYAGTRFSAAACLPLVLEGERAAFGYLAAHFYGTRSFDDPHRAKLGRAAAATTRAIHRLVSSDTRGDHEAGEGDPSREQLRSELDGLREAMKTRADIEQAKGMLMERFALDDEQSWNLIRRISNETNIKVNTLARALVQRVAVQGLPQGQAAFRKGHMNRPLRLAIVDDSSVVAGVASFLAAERIDVVETGASPPVVTDVDIVLYDTFGQVQGVAIDLEDLVRDSGAKVVIYSWNIQPETIRQAMAGGACGYLSKVLTGPEVVAALERVMRGEIVVLTGENETSVGGVGDWPGRSLGLSPREAEVLALIAQGLTNQEIADRVIVSINTVKTYVRCAYRKIGAERRSQAVVWALENGFKPDTLRSVDPALLIRPGPLATQSSKS